MHVNRVWGDCVWLALSPARWSTRCVYVRRRVFVKGSGDGPCCSARACADDSSATATAATLGSSTPACPPLGLYPSPPYMLPAVLGMDIPPSTSDSRDGERCKEQDAGRQLSAGRCTERAQCISYIALPRVASHSMSRANLLAALPRVHLRRGMCARHVRLTPNEQRADVRTMLERDAGYSIASQGARRGSTPL